MNNIKEKKEELTVVHYFKISSREQSKIKFQFLAKNQYRKYGIKTINKVWE